MSIKKYLPLFSLVLLVAGCDNCNNKNVKIAKWATATDGATLACGSTINAQLAFNDGEEKIDSVVYAFDRERKMASSILTEAFKISTETLNPGVYNLTATIYKSDKKEVHSAAITLVSDIKPELIEKKIGAVFPHNTKNFTEGFFILNDMVYESTGMNGTSYTCRYKLGNVAEEKLTTLPNEYFGEGSICYDNKLIQLTWKNGIGLIYDATTLKKIGEFRIGGEGWGLTYNGSQLIMSDGTHRLFFMNKETYAVEKIVEVYDNIGRVVNLNELEYVDGIIYANIWMKDEIVKIDAKNGKILSYRNCEGLLTSAEIEKYQCDVLNGIAYDSKTKKLYITGKNWPKIFELISN